MKFIRHDPDIEPQPEEKDQQTKAKIDNTQLKQRKNCIPLIEISFVQIIFIFIEKISTPPTDVNVSH